MALTGTFTKYNEIESGTITYDFTYPDDLPEGHEHYDKRGTTEVHEEPNRVKVGTEYVDKYIVVKMASLNSGFGVGLDSENQPISGTFHKYYYTNAQYLVYDSAESRSLWPNQPAEEWEIDQVTNNTGSQDLISFVYTKIKEQEGFENLIDA